MRIALLGATGRTGREVLDQAIAAGHTIAAYARRPGAVSRTPGVNVVSGQLDDVNAMAATFDGCAAVVVALGTSVRNRNMPLHSFAIPAVIEAAQSAGVTRVIQLSALGVGDTLANTRYPYRLAAATLLRGNFAEHHAGESHLADSGLDWTTLHPGPLFNGRRTARPTIVDAATGTRMPGSPRTMRADVAAAILDMLENSDTYRRKMLITSKASS